MPGVPQPSGRVEPAHQDRLGFAQRTGHATDHHVGTVPVAQLVPAAMSRPVRCGQPLDDEPLHADGRPESSYRNLLRAGFQPAYIRPNYVSPPEDAAA